MIDYEEICSELKRISGMADEEILNYKSSVIYTADSVWLQLKKEPDEKEMPKLYYLCAVKAYYRIMLLESGGVKSFSAGDVSYTAGDGSLSGIKALLTEAEADCIGLISSGSFAFEAV